MPTPRAVGAFFGSFPSLNNDSSPCVGWVFTSGRQVQACEYTPLYSQAHQDRYRDRRRSSLAGTGTAAAHAAGGLSAPSHDFGVAADFFSGHGSVSGNVLRNDYGATAVVRHTNPSDGKLSINADGRFTYIPNSGFTGTDTFAYTRPTPFSSPRIRG
jgi:hypothetical protein